MLPIVAPESTRGLPLFNGLSEQEKDMLIGSGRIRQVSRGEMLFAHGDPITHFYIIASGSMQLFRANAEGDEKTIAVCKAGHTLCEDEIMDSCRGHRVNCTVVEEGAVMEFPVIWLKNAAREYHAFALNLLSLMAGRAHMAEVEAEHQATMSAAQLVACFMQRLCVLYGFNPSGFELPYSKTLIASRLGMEVETFSRTLAKLRDHGLVVNGSQVQITDLGKIGQYVCGMCSVSGECATHQAMEQRMQGKGTKTGA